MALPWGSVEPAETCGGAGSVDCRLRVIIELLEFFRGSAPVEDVRLIPHLKIPALNLPDPVALDLVVDQRINQVIPLLVVFWGHSPADALVFTELTVGGVEPSVFCAPGVRQVSGHEANLKERLAVVRQVDVHHPVDQIEVINRAARFILQIRVGGAPLVEGVHDAGAQHVVGAHVVGLFQPAELFDQSHAARRVGVVALVVAHVVPRVLKRPRPFPRVHPDLNLFHGLTPRFF